MAQAQALVIDDEPDICELLTMTLGRMDIHAESAVDVASAKTLLGSRKFDICLTDMRLPDGDGLELVEWIQSVVSGSVGRASPLSTTPIDIPPDTAVLRHFRPSLSTETRDHR